MSQFTGASSRSRALAMLRDLVRPRKWHCQRVSESYKSCSRPQRRPLGQSSQLSTKQPVFNSCSRQLLYILRYPLDTTVGSNVYIRSVHDNLLQAFKEIMPSCDQSPQVSSTPAQGFVSFVNMRVTMRARATMTMRVTMRARADGEGTNSIEGDDGVEGGNVYLSLST